MRPRVSQAIPGPRASWTWAARRTFGRFVVVGAAMALPHVCGAQSLRGSEASVDRMYAHATDEALAFYTTPADVQRAVRRGRLVPLTSSADLVLHAVGYPYVRPTTRTFVRRLAAEAHAVCGEPLEVTSAVRPEADQPENSSERSVHPTGMAIDLHKPAAPRCRRWLRSTLRTLEAAGVLEATEEFHPPHFHVAVYPTPYRRYLARRATTSRRRAVSGRRPR